MWALPSTAALVRKSSPMRGRLPAIGEARLSATAAVESFDAEDRFAATFANEAGRKSADALVVAGRPEAVKRKPISGPDAKPLRRVSPASCLDEPPAGGAPFNGRPSF